MWKDVEKRQREPLMTKRECGPSKNGNGPTINVMTKQYTN